MTRSHDSKAFERAKRQQRLRRLTGQAIGDYRMIEEGDKVMVCLSGGKDSYALLDMLISLRKSAPVSFDLIAVNLDQKQPGFPEHVLPDYMATKDIPFYVIERDTYSTVKRVVPEGKTTCALCSRLRRGTLYGFAEANGVTKIALGHHRDDIVETLFLNLFFGSKMKTMPPKLVSDDGRYVVIRPLAYCKESDLAQFAEDQSYPIIPCNLCGSQPNLKRAEIKAMIADWEKRYPGRVENLFRGLQNVVPSHLMDTELHPFDSPNPDDLLTYRRDNPLDDASEIREALAEAELNPWVEVQTNDAQIIQTSGAIVQAP
ncbi:MAG: tRNA 2-thiocytidine(32) synthetase TtcA [Gammaproteobacteria bacterium]|jgi:tRNA 2-thiocytidine biosynthesis protein TtcA|nr:tRNA 2-thiocytidine(32) synthetase TtcA [Gammaproteobacteria bacterium]NCW73414.1 tRNA 2-thiocytidine(32) synthetase TtcA [Gammaproteobacteria bacterium]